jgi:DNA-binding CsgD family transcriptional regulator
MCEALEIVGRCARPNDLEEAERAFARAYGIADESGLAVWRVRALHELGTIDLLRSADDARLLEARDLAAGVGALATTAVIDVQLAAALAIRAEAEPALRYARRGADLARRYGLELTYAAARGFEGHAHAYAGERGEMEVCFADASSHSQGDPGIAVIIRTGAAFLSLADEDRSRALHELAAAATLTWESAGDQTTGPSAGMWALMRAVAEPDREVALPEAPPWWRPVHVLSQGWLRYAEAVVLGRTGRPHEAGALVAVADAGLEGIDWYRMLGRRLVAEAALADGWGDPVPWLRESLAYFEGLGHERVASACRSLLRRAGVPVPRRDPDAASVPPPLRALGITAREREVLDLLGEGLSNREIAERLFLSPRTVERHVANLTVKTGVERRTQLVAFAARAGTDAG